MKYCYLTILFLITFPSAAQHVTVKLKSGEVKTLQAQANTSTQLLTTEGSINYTDIDSLTFHGYKPSYDNLKIRLLDRGVKLAISGERPITSPVITPVAAGDELQRQIDYERFVNQRNGGKLLQLVGVVGLGVSSYLSIANAKHNAKEMDPDKQKFAPEFLPWAALGAMSIGIVIDMNAAKHLRKR